MGSGDMGGNMRGEGKMGVGKRRGLADDGTSAPVGRRGAGWMQLSVGFWRCFEVL